MEHAGDEPVRKVKKDKKTRKLWNYKPELPLENSPLFTWPLQPKAILRWFVSTYLSLSIRMFVLAVAAVCWLFLTPSLATTSELHIGWIVALWLRNMAVMFLVAGALHLYFYCFHKQGEQLQFDTRHMVGSQFKFKDQVLDNMYFSLVYGVTFWTAFEAMFLWMYGSGMLQMSGGLSTNPVWFVAVILLIPIWHSFHFYWIHRVLHWGPLYKKVHSLHHKNVNIGPWSGMSMHPVESFVYLTSVLIHLAVLSHPFHIVYHLQFLVLNAVIAHSGFESLLVKEKSTVKLGRFHHQLHHRFFECNYGNAEMPWDKWFGSFHDGTGDAHERIFGRRM